MMRLSKVYYGLALLVLIIGLSGCELRRDEADISDPGPVSELPPTLAPLNAETNLSSEATVVPTVINVQPTATLSAEGDVAPLVNDGASPTSIPIDLSNESEVVTEEPVEQAAAEEVIEAEEEAVAEENAIEFVPSAEEAIVVDATTSEELPTGGPVAANPPYSATTGDYNSTPEVASGGSYIVQPGDTLFSIARRFGTSVEALAYSNGLTNDVIQVGQVLSVSGDASGVPAPTYQQPSYQQQPSEQQPTYQQPTYQQPYVGDGSGLAHIVAPGETLFRIALQYTTSVDAIAAANGIPYPYIIQTGQQLIIPSPRAYGPPPGEGYSQPGYGAAPQQPYQQPYQQEYGAVPQQPYQEPYQGYDAAPQQPYDQGYGAPQDNTYVNPSAGTHTIAPGETLYSIATRYGTSAEALAAANGLSNPNQIFVGQVLFLP